MPARVVLVHDDTEFLEQAAAALKSAGHDVAAFSGSMAALAALEEARAVELLITPVNFPAGTPNGVALARMARHRRHEIKILFTALPETREFADGLGEFMPMPVDIPELVAAVRTLLEKGNRRPT